MDKNYDRINDIPDKYFEDYNSETKQLASEVKKHMKPATSFLISLFIAVIFLFPFYLLLINMFKTNNEIAADKLNLPSEWNWSNVKDAASATEFFQSLMNTLIVTVISNVIIIILSAGGAWMMVRSKSKSGKVIYVIYLFSLIIPFQIMMLPLVWWVDSIGLSGIPGLIIVYGGFGIPLSTFMIHGFVKGLPISIEEAAFVEGASVLKVFFKIIIPLLKPILFTVLILNTIWLWNDFLIPNLMLINESDFTITLRIVSLQGAFGRDLKLIMSALMLATIPALLFFLFSQKHIIKGTADGAIK